MREVADEDGAAVAPVCLVTALLSDDPEERLGGDGSLEGISAVVSALPVCMLLTGRDGGCFDVCLLDIRARHRIALRKGQYFRLS